MTRPGLRKALAGIALGLVAAAAAWLLGLLPFFETVELKAYDLRVRWTADPATARRDIALVTIDDTSIRKLEPLVGRWPWPRLVHAALIDYLAQAGARVIAYDVLFTEHDRRTFTVGGETWTGEESDRELVDATRRAGNVVFAADVTGEGTEQPAVASLPLFVLDDSIEPRSSLILPFDDLARAAAGIGHNLLVLDADGPVRRTPPFVHVGKAFVPSLAAATAMRAEGVAASSITVGPAGLRFGGRRVPLVDMDVPSFYGPPTRARRMLIHFTGPVLQAGKPTYDEFPFYDLFYSQQQVAAGEKPFVDPARFRDRIVFVGTTAAGLSDVFTVPFAAGKMPGAQIHANITDDLLSGRFMRPAGAAANLAVVLVSALILGAVSVYFGVWAAVAAAAVTAVAVFGGSLLLFRQGVWLEVARPGLALAFAAFTGTAYRYFVEEREKRQVKQVFSRYVSRDVFDQLMADPSRARLGGARREMSVLFSDIRGFTTFTERGLAEDIVSQLNEYFSTMVARLFRHQGTVDKFVGDMVMALFGAPLDDPDHADHAVQAALGMLEELRGLNARWAAEGRPTLDIGVGVNTGEMVAGNIGSETIMSYTVIGDAVNLGSRLESLNKQYGTHIIISEYTRNRLKGRYDMRSLGTVVVKGKSEPVAIYEVATAATDVPPSESGHP